MSQDVTCHVRDRVLSIRFARPAKKNAITLSMYGAMSDALDRAEADADVRVAVIAGTDGCFSSGNDIGDFMRAEGSDDLKDAGRFLATLVGFSKPLVAAVDGVAIGIGTTMLLHCDLVYATPRARFKMPFVDLGLVPEAASSVLLPALMGYQRTCELLLLGDELSAERARELGLVTEVVSIESLDALVAERTARLAARAPNAMRATKALLKAPLAEQVTAALRREGEVFGTRLASAEATEAFQAFAERRAPDFSKQ